MRVSYQRSVHFPSTRRPILESSFSPHSRPLRLENVGTPATTKYSSSLPILRIGRRTADSSSGYLVEKEIKGGNTAVPGNDEISPGVSWRFARAARDPLDPPAIA